MLNSNGIFYSVHILNSVHCTACSKSPNNVTVTLKDSTEEYCIRGSVCNRLSMLNKRGMKKICKDRKAV